MEKARKSLRMEHINQWAELRCQGQGVSDFAKEKIGNGWIKEYHLLKPSRCIDALRLRTNTFGVKTVLTQADRKMDVNCRRCHAQPETLGYVLGMCQYTKGLRIKRHDEVKSLLAKKLSKNNEVSVEPTLKTGDNLYKPDLVIKNEERILVVDVTIRYENRNYLLKAHKEKTDKHHSCLNHLKAKYNVDVGEISPVVLRTRRAITPKTTDTLKRLGLNKSGIKTIIINVLCSSIEVCNMFLDN